MKESKSKHTKKTGLSLAEIIDFNLGKGKKKEKIVPMDDRRVITDYGAFVTIPVLETITTTHTGVTTTQDGVDMVINRWTNRNNL